jgi:hypothetical protein
MSLSAPPFAVALQASPIIATVGCAEREMPVYSNVKQPRPLAKASRSRGACGVRALKAKTL